MLSTERDQRSRQDRYHEDYSGSYPRDLTLSFEMHGHWILEHSKSPSPSLDGENFGWKKGPNSTKYYKGKRVLHLVHDGKLRMKSILDVN